MEAIIQAIILGIIQGLTEFLPVSSSGHLELAKYFLGYKATQNESMIMTVTLHAATALSTIIVFRKDIAEIFAGLFKAVKNSDYKNNESFFFAIKIILSMIPAALVGVLFDEQLEALFNEQIVLVGFMLILTGGLLFLADRAKDSERSVSIPNAIIIGIAQAIAILPGISRSGATISTSVLLGVDKSKSARFSFLMVIPLILGKMAKDLLDDDFIMSTESLTQVGIGFVVALITGIIACTWMIKIVKNSQLKYFAFYCFAMGIFAILFKTYYPVAS